MEPKMYWWVLYANSSVAGNSAYWNETVVDIHPFTTSKMLHMQLISWSVITEKEYKLWKQLNNKTE
jgi:hypothetical protein